MENTTNASLQSNFTRRQTRKLRSTASRDKNAWAKLVRISPNRMDAANIVQPKASTSMLTIEEEDGLQIRATKRNRGNAEPNRKFAIPTDDSIDEAMSGFAFMNLDLSKALQDKSNAQPSLISKKQTFAKAIKDENVNLERTKVSGGDPPSSAIFIPTSTPPQNNQTAGNGFAALEEADLSMIAPIPQFRFTGRANSESSQLHEQPEFTFTKANIIARNNPTSHTSQPALSLSKLLATEVQNPASSFIAESSKHSTLRDDDFANLLQKQLALSAPTPVIPHSTDPESQQTTTTEGQLASESDVDVLQPLQGRKRKVSKSKSFSTAISYESLKAKKKVIKEKPRSSSERIPSVAVRKGKNVSPSAVQWSRSALVGMRSSKGSVIRDTPVKADPEASVDELGLA